VCPSRTEHNRGSFSAARNLTISVAAEFTAFFSQTHFVARRFLYKFSMSTLNTPVLLLRDSEATARTRPTKVMVVEDEAIIALDIQMQLINAGFAVTGRAATAARAFRAIERDMPDLVLMDIRLKGEMDGVEAASIIRSRYSIPVIYLSSHTDDATLDRARATEPHGFLVKPFAIGSMKAAITMAVHKHLMERRFQTNPAILSAILHGLPDAVIVTKPTGEILLLNHAAEQCTGWSRGESTGRKLSEIACVRDGDGRKVWPSLFQHVSATGTTARIPGYSGLVAKNGARWDVSGKISPLALDGESEDLLVILLDVTDTKKSDPPPLHNGSSISIAEWMIALLCLPGKQPQPAGILLLDHSADHLAIKLNTNIEFEDEIVSAFWNELALDLSQRARERGGNRVVEWLEGTASNILQFSRREAVDFQTTSLTETLDRLYHDHIDPGSCRPLSAQA